MIDFSERIEGIAEDISYAIKKECKLNTCGTCNGCEFNVAENTKEIDCQSYLVAKVLMQMNYRKIQYGTVVFTRKEFVNFIRTLLDGDSRDIHKTKFVSKDEVDYWRDRCEEIASVANKETAKDILSEIRGYYPVDLDHCDKGEAFILSLCYDLAKKYKVDIDTED